MPIDDPSWRRANQWLATPLENGTPDLIVAGVPTAIGSLSPSQGRHPGGVAHGDGAVRHFRRREGSRHRRLGRLRPGRLWRWKASISVRPCPGSRVEAASLPIGKLLRVHRRGQRHNQATESRGSPVGRFGGVGVITLDAHHDVEGRSSHGPTNGTPIRGLIEDGLGPGRVAQVGIAGFVNSAPYRQFCDSPRFHRHHNGGCGDVGGGGGDGSGARLRRRRIRLAVSRRRCRRARQRLRTGMPGGSPGRDEHPATGHSDLAPPGCTRRSGQPTSSRWIPASMLAESPSTP